MNFFPRDELFALYRLVFAHVLEKSNNANRGKDNNNNNNNSNSNSNNIKENQVVQEIELFDKALDLPFPRVDLNEMYQRLRAILAQLEQVTRSPCLSPVSISPVLTPRELLTLLEQVTTRLNDAVAFLLNP